MVRAYSALLTIILDPLSKPFRVFEPKERVKALQIGAQNATIKLYDKAF